MRIGENRPIWMLHSPPIKEYKSLSFKDINFFIFFKCGSSLFLQNLMLYIFKDSHHYFWWVKDIKLMDYMVINDATLLHLTNDETNKVNQ